MNGFDRLLLRRKVSAGVGVYQPSRIGSILPSAAACCVLASAIGCGFQLNHALPSITLNPASIDFGSVQVGMSSTPQKLTVTNTSTHSVGVASITTNMPEFAAQSDCPKLPATLGPNATCTVTITFIPKAAGSVSATATVSYTASGSPASAALKGSGTAAKTGVSLSPASLSWTNVPVGQASNAQVVTLTNIGSAPLTISSIKAGSAFTVPSTTCPLAPSTVAAGDSCTITVAFLPSVAGSSNDKITIVDSDPGSPQQVVLSGMAVQGMAPLFSSTSLLFPDTAVGSKSKVEAVTLTNPQTTPLTIDGIAASPEFDQTNDCPATLAANAKCTISIAFAPTSSGAKTGSLTLTYPSASQSVSLSGTGITATTAALSGTVSVSPKSYAFPNQAIGTKSAPATITLSNGLTTTLTISSIQIGAPFSQTNTCGGSLASGNSCTISVTYAPTAIGYNTTNLVITDNATNSPQTVPISGNAVTAVSTVPVTGGWYFYNQIVLTRSTPLPVSITNNQSTALTISSMTTSADYPFTTNCVGSNGSGSLAAHATCTVEIVFYPQAIGKRTSALTINESAYGSPLVIPLTGTGIAGDPGLTVTVGPHSPCALPSQRLQFSAYVTGTTNTAVNWYVNNVLHGNSTVGTIDSTGLYTAPATVGTYGIKAVSQASTSVSGYSKMTVTNSPVFTIYPFTSSIPVSAQQTFQPQVCTAPDPNPVSWTVDGIPGGNSTVGTITNAGVYTAPAVPGKHTVRVTDAAANKTSGAVVTVFSQIAVDFGSRTSTTYPVSADLFGYGRGESIHSASDRTLITQAGVTVARLYAQIPQVYATQIPNWTKIDPMIAAIQSAGQKAMLQMSGTPPWLQPSPNPCGAGNSNVPPTNLSQWAQIAASFVAHMDAKFPGIVQDYEIWNEPNAVGLCSSSRLTTYMSIYAAAAPLMKQQAATDGQPIRIGGPAISGFSPIWISTLVNTSTTAPYVDFVSYHQYIFGSTNLEVQWDTYTQDNSLYQQTQDPGNGALANYNKAYALVKAGKQPLGANTPLYLTEYNTNWAFYKDCCRNDPTYGPLWNALYITDLLNSASAGLPVPGKLVYFAGSGYPYICLIGVPDQNSDCLYSALAVPQPYPQYYAYQLISSRNYLGLVDGGHMAKSIAPPTGGGGLAITAFYNASQDAVVITNPTPAAYSQITVSLQNLGFSSPHATLYQIVNGALINSSSLALSPQGTGYAVTISVPAYSVQGISVKGP
ncbi:MAG TPA: choice-of-anchor D domain-containing protein [Acidisarcina sp.]|nr:choice-of-anchor D domain-containing protein [Acidisarcina sp.]